MGLWQATRDIDGSAITPVVGNRFISVCSCGWRSSPQRTAGLAGALLDGHRRVARNATEREDDSARSDEDPVSERVDASADDLAGRRS